MVNYLHLTVPITLIGWLLPKGGRGGQPVIPPHNSQLSRALIKSSTLSNTSHYTRLVTYIYIFLGTLWQAHGMGPSDASETQDSCYIGDIGAATGGKHFRPQLWTKRLETASSGFTTFLFSSTSQQWQPELMGWARRRYALAALEVWRHGSSLPASSASARLAPSATSTNQIISDHLRGENKQG